MSVRASRAAPAQTAAPSRRPGLSLKPPPDPGFAALRRAARAAVVITVTFVFGEFVLHDTQNVIFIVFGGFALLVMSDFGEQRRPRAIAYLTDGARVVHTQMTALLHNLTRFADRLDPQDGRRDQARVAPDTLRSADLDCLRRWRNDDRSGPGAMAVVIAGEWVENMARMEDDLEEPVARAVAAGQTPWWR